MSFISRLIQLNELQVNGQSVDDNDDFNVGEDEGTPTNTEAQSEAPDEVAQDDAETQTKEAEPTSENDEPTPQSDSATEDQEDDFTLDDTENETPASDEEGGNDTESENEGVPRNSTDEDSGDDNFTIDGGDESTDDNSDSAEESTGDQKSAPEKDLPKDPSDAISDDDDRAAEEAIYDSLTDDQKRIRVLQLKLNYKDLYETIVNAIEGINGIPKNADNLETIKRLVLLLTKAKNILIDYVENNFDTCPYLENYTTYIKYIAVFRTASKVIEELNNSKN